MDKLEVTPPPPEIDAVMKKLEAAKSVTDQGVDFWMARALQIILGYDDWKNFINVIEKAKVACRKAGYDPNIYFSDAGKVMSEGSNAKVPVEDIFLTRYACYLIAMNGDVDKVEIATAQTYFATKARMQEIREMGDQAQLGSDDDRRVLLRKEITEHNRKLAGAAKEAGVVTRIDHAIFQNFGYKGQYSGRTAKDRHREMGLKESQNILDHMGSTELAANLFRATQTEEKLRLENVKGKENANRTHFEVGQKVRKAIVDIGGVMPENLPPAPSIKEVEKRLKKAGKELPPKKED